METNRKGLCINAGNCKNADNKLPIELSVAEDFVCPECGRELVPVEKKNKLKIPKAALILLPLVIAILGLGGYAWYWYSKAKAAVETGEAIINMVTDSTKINATVNAVTSVAEEAKEIITTTTNKPRPDALGPVDIQEQINKLSDAGVKYDAKTSLKTNLLTYFTDGNAKVVTLGANQTNVGESDISNFSEMLRTSNQHYTFVRAEKSGEKFSKIFVKAD